MSGSSLIKILDAQSGEELFSCTFEDAHLAFKRAKEYEEYGLDIEIKAPGIIQTLASGLGFSDESQHEYSESADQELQDHDCSSCAIQATPLKSSLE